MTTFTMQRVGGDFVVTGPDIEPKKLKESPCDRQMPGAQSPKNAPNSRAITACAMN
jgi:hypothetical protein